MDKLIGFAFKRNISSSVLKSLDAIDQRFYIDSDYNKIDLFIKELIKAKPSHILGLGMYSRQDREKLRIENRCSLNNETFQINSFLNPGDNTKRANGIGNSYCNYVSSKIMKAIKDKKLVSEYTFIHIPKSFSIEKAIREIDDMLDEKIKSLTA